MKGQMAMDRKLGAGVSQSGVVGAGNRALCSPEHRPQWQWLHGKDPALVSRLSPGIRGGQCSTAA